MQVSDLDFSQAKVLVVGDVMLDEYVQGSADRISPEAPVPVLDVGTRKSEYRAGGAAGAAAVVASLGGTVTILGLIGNDPEGGHLMRLCGEYGNTDMVVGLEVTTQKIRCVADGQQMLRIDKEQRRGIPEEALSSLVERTSNTIESDEPEVVVISDYGKGAVTKELVDEVMSHGVFVVVDPKPVSHRDWYKGVSVVTPNQNEASGMVGVPKDEVEDWGKVAREISDILETNVLVTLGGDGMVLHMPSVGTYHHQAEVVEVFDVTGAGDSVIGTIAVCLASEQCFTVSCKIANIVAGIAVGHLGNKAVTIGELKAKAGGKAI